MLSYWSGSYRQLRFVACNHFSGRLLPFFVPESVYSLQPLVYYSFILSFFADGIILCIYFLSNVLSSLFESELYRSRHRFL